MRRKFTIYNVQCTITLFLLFYILHSTLLVPAYAEEASKSASPSASLLEKLNLIKAQVASKASQLVQEINDKIENKAIAGAIKTLSKKQLTITSKKGERIVLVNEYTIFSIPKVKLSRGQSSSGRNPDVSDLKEEDFIVTLGDMDDKNRLVAKKVIKFPERVGNEKKTFWGEVEGIKGSVITLKLKDGEKLSAITSYQTKFVLKKEEASIRDVKSNKAVVVTGILDNEKTIQVGFVYLIPSFGVNKRSLLLRNKPDKSATNSATPSATKK